MPRYGRLTVLVDADGGWYVELAGEDVPVTQAVATGEVAGAALEDDELAWLEGFEGEALRAEGVLGVCEGGGK